MPYPALTYSSNDWTTAYPVSGATFSRPIPGVNVDYILRQTFCIRKDEFTPLALNTPYDESYDGSDAFPEWGSFLLVEEGEDSDIGGGCVQWTRTYAKVPATHNQPTSLAYTLIGFFGTWGVNITTVTGRDRRTRAVPARIQFDYFLLDGSTEIGDIPIEQELKFYVGMESNLTDFLADSPPFTIASTPSRTAYQTMIDNGDEIVAEASKITRWLGNIIERQTIYVKAQ